jgi:hypothetical protein
MGRPFARVHLAPDPIQPNRQSSRESAAAKAIVDCGAVEVERGGIVDRRRDGAYIDRRGAQGRLTLGLRQKERFEGFFELEAERGKETVMSFEVLSERGFQMS